MDCTKIFAENNSSLLMLNRAFNDDSGSWWWWINVLGTVIFGLIGLIGNLICFFVLNHYSSSSHSYVVYLKSLSLFDLLTLLYELIQSLNDLFIYLFQINLLNFRYSIICKLYDYSKYSIILISCWTIVGLTIDRFILVCDPWTNKWPNFSRRFCNSICAKRIILIFLFLSLLINIPQFVYKEWICRPRGFQYSAIYNLKSNLNSRENKKMCSCRVSPFLKPNKMKFFIFWNNYIFYLLFYTFIPATILIGTNIAILKGMIQVLRHQAFAYFDSLLSPK